MMIGFFMIMVDSTIVVIANPTIKIDLHTGYATVVWVTSAYLLGCAVVLLVAGRLGDRFGTKNLYLIGLGLFTVASIGCGLSGSVAVLIAARVVQGVGAGVLTPQTLSMITRVFPPERRGVAVSVWGTTAGVATLVGPLAGGALVDGLGWQWIFFINVPIGVAGLALAAWLVPVLPTQAQRFDLVGVALSGLGMFLIVFGLQEGQAAHWQPWVWAMIVAGIGFMSVFVYWQAVNTREPLIPLRIFADRDFGLCNAGVAVTAFAMTALMLPLPFFLQAGCGLSSTRSALVIAPMAVVGGALAPFVGVLVDRYHPGPVLGFGFSTMAIGLTWLSFEMSPSTPIWRLLLAFAVIGVGSAFVWAPLTATATRNLPVDLAGAGSAVFNSMRQLGAVLGSAGMAAFMTWRIGSEMPSPAPSASAEDATTVQLPEFLREPFAAAMAQSVLLPAFVVLFGVVAALFVLGFAPSADAELPDEGDDYEDYDDDDYVEFLLVREPDVAPPPPPRVRAVPVRKPVSSGPIGFAHNGSRVEGGKRFRPMASPGHRYRPDPDDDPAGYGRHSG
jgi:EmrB/QacA subfamily drug resistance transporter